jgi:hypothetical protein
MSKEIKVKLGQDKKEEYAGDFVLNGQETGDDKGFSHVSKIWLEQCMTFDQGRKVLAEQQEQIQDFRTPLNAWEPVVTDKDQFALRNRDTGRDYVPTDHCLNLMPNVGRGMSTWGLRALRDPIRHAQKVGDDGEKEVMFKRDRADAEVMRDYVALHLFREDRVDQGKSRLFRTWNDGTLRALLSEEYAIVNNGWYLDLLQKLIPGGMLSHWRGDADAIYGNILIPDTIREEDDSDYGGMLSIGNSEIGTRRIDSLPSVFRAICMNGCIWDQEVGMSFRQVHRGEINFTDLAAKIKENLETQIPLLPQGIERVLGIRAYGCGDTPLPNVFAQLAADNKVSRRDIQGTWRSYGDEVNILGKKDARTAFGLMNALTRYGQTLGNDQWIRFDRIGGTLASMERNDWDKFLNRAGNMSEKQMKVHLGDASLVA